MPTFLTTPKMAPELAARIEASVRGHERPSGERGVLGSGARSALVRLLVLAIAASIAALAIHEHRARGSVTREGVFDIRPASSR